MDKEQLRRFLNGQYTDYKAFLENIIFPIFGEEDFDDALGDELLKRQPERRSLAEATGIKSIKNIGSIFVGIEPLQIFDITVSDRVRMERNRVSIQRLIRSVMDIYSSSFMIFHYDDDEHWDWRFTYCHKGKNSEEYTDSKRYTFLLGPGQSCRTATDNFMSLYEKRGKIDFKDIEQAFSVEALSKEFFGKYKYFYEKFVKYMTTDETIRATFLDKNFDHTNMSEEQIRDREEKPMRDYAKKLLGRIVFLHFLQKKGWLGVKAGEEWGTGPRDFMLQLFENATNEQRADFLDGILEPLYDKGLDTKREDDLFDTQVKDYTNVRIPYLNGGLFERDTLDKKICKLPAEYFEELLDTLSWYNFTIDENDPNDAEVGVDPEMLGRIFENLLEDNKDKGAYYTPKEIVQYMCRESLIAYLQTDLKEEDKEKVRKFVMEHDAEPLGELKEEIVNKLIDVKICDPAIGSGAFPMGLLRELYFCHSAIDPNVVNYPSETKRYIIQNNIYGVDIDRGAVDIAQLRFWLALVVDEKEPAPLPNLDFKIMQGNSLLEQYDGVDLSKLTYIKKDIDHNTGLQTTIYDNELNALRLSLLHKMEEYYTCDEHSRRLQLRGEITSIVKKQIEADYKQVNLDGIDIYANSKFFLWHTWFNDVFSREGKEGFDIVIGNPPYVQLQNNSGTLAELYANCGYETYARTGDIYCLFYEFGQRLLKPKGHLCFITSNKWMRAGYGEKLRGFLANRTNPKLLIDFGGMRVFESVTVDTNILLFSKSKNECKTQCVKLDKQYENGIGNLSVFVEHAHTECSFINSDNWVILSEIEQRIKRKIETIGTPLKDWDIQINYGIKTGCNEAFIINTEKRNEILNNCKTEEERVKTDTLIRPILRGRDIKRYGFDWANLWLINTHNGLRGRLSRIRIEDYPAVKCWLDNGGIAYNGNIYRGYEQIATRKDQGDTPYNLRNCKYLEDFSKHKIAWASVGETYYSLVEKDMMLLDTNYFFSIKNEVYAYYLLGILNSRLVTFWINSEDTQIGGGGAYRHYKYNLEKICIPIVQDVSIFNDVVEQILRCVKEKKNSSKYVNELNKQVYLLYNLTQDECDFIDSALKEDKQTHL